jgi:hypothetical protein
MVFREDSEMRALSGGLADELDGAVEVGGGIEGLQGEWLMAFLMVSNSMTNLRCQLYQGNFIGGRHVSCLHQASSNELRACAGQIVSALTGSLIVIAKKGAIRKYNTLR